ncbi:MAG: restriction endonuclease subunit S, partial [Bryobacterales bacterium]|nr:restriction endonuclease subunit S [Bryobacterales bacterium]
MKLATARWKVTTLGEHSDVQTGFPFKSHRYTDAPNGIRLLRGDNIAQGSLRWEGARQWPNEERPHYAKYELRRDDVVLAMDRPWVEAGLKYAWLSESDLPCLLVQRVARLRGTNSLLTPFIRYIIGHPTFTDYLKGIWTGVTVPHISESQIRAFKFSLPPLPVQQRIIEILSAYDDLIQNNTRRIKILEEMAQRIYQEWFVHFRFPGHENVRMVDSELGPIPEGWSPTRLGDQCSEVRRSVNPSDVDPETPYIGLEHMPRKSVALAEWGRAGDVASTKLRFYKGEILFGKIRPYFHKVGAALVDGVASSDAIVIVTNSAESFGPVLCCVSSDEFVRHATQTSHGTKMPRANWLVLSRYALPTPPRNILQRFNGVIQDMVTMVGNLSLQNRNLRKTRNLLLPKLISGEIPVDTADD